jgi:hypothetical protein
MNKRILVTGGPVGAKLERILPGVDGLGKISRRAIGEYLGM